ncbi:hypothetical protein BB559_004792 [Furculomyces boomerangus]|uniref:Major facilitator superfamily (MFS) profile domain-containing protein n=1 Tax=Furculomyces boomerangus TaxID=61424 RepID=A0A2T9YCN7_9FUNG|nr:hypothetical protein BB559_004792 [Furculomyces boomerangus]
MEETKIESAKEASNESEVFSDKIPEDYKSGVSGKLDVSAWLIVVTELCERFTFYGITVMLPEYLMYKYNDSRSAVVLKVKAFSFLAYFSTIIGAVVADQWLGKFRTIFLFSIWYFFGTVLLSIFSMDNISLKLSSAMFIVSVYFFVGIGTGGIKANVSSFVAEQVDKVYHSTEKPGVYISPTLTVEKCYRYFYWAINIGAFLGMAVCPQLAMHMSYTAAFLSTLIVILISFVLFTSGRKKYKINSPKYSIFGKTYRCILYAIENRKNTSNQNKIYKNTDTSKEDRNKSLLSEKNHWLDISKGLEMAEWDDSFVEGIKSCIEACKVFSFFPFYWMLYNNVTDVLILQAMRMRKPNWISYNQLGLLTQISVVSIIPLYEFVCTKILYKKNIILSPITRIAIGFVVITIGFIYTTIIQKIIYTYPPYYNFAGGNVDKFSHNDISVWWQVPSYILIGSSEIFASVTGLEYAFSKAPPELKSVLSAIYLFTNCLGSLIGLGLSGFSEDPNILNMFIGETGLMTVLTAVFWIVFRKRA